MDAIKKLLQRKRQSLPQALEISPPTEYPQDNGPIAWEAYYAQIGERPVKKLCPVCGDQKWVIDAATNQLHRCPKCGQAERRHWLAQNCGLEPSEQQVKLADWKMPVGANQARSDKQRKQARAAIVKAIAERKGLYTFWGDFGSGKSFALKIVANELRMSGAETFYSTLEGILSHLRGLYAAGRTSQHRRDPDKFWKRLLDIPVLCLDEVTRFNATDWAQAQLFDLADTRYRRKDSHLTLFATNDDPRTPLSTDNSLGYLFSRMREMYVVHLQDDVRVAKGAEW